MSDLQFAILITVLVALLVVFAAVVANIIG